MKKYLKHINIKQLAFWLVFAILFILTILFVKQQIAKTPCVRINVNIIDTSGHLFVNKEEILKLIKKHDLKTIGYPIDSVNTLKIEKVVLKHPSVKKVDAYCSVDGSLYIDITQRQPLFRIINYNGESYYIDKTGKMMELSNKYTAHVLIANGNINEPFESRYQLNFDKNKYNDELERGKLLVDIYHLAEYIDKDKFLKHQIQQIYVQNDSSFVLVPVVGLQKIIFGKIDNYKTKFRNLKAFYKKGITKKGWNVYSEINLKYENQIVCKKR